MAVNLSNSDFLVGNYHIIFFQVFVIFLIFSIFFKAIVCVCVCVCVFLKCLTYSYILLLYFSQIMCFFLKENENIEKTRAFLLLPFVSLMVLKMPQYENIRTRLSTAADAFAWGWGLLWQRSPWALAGSSPVRGTGEKGGKTAACGRCCLLNRIRSLKIGWRTTNFTDNVGVSVKKTVYNCFNNFSNCTLPTIVYLC